MKDILNSYSLRELRKMISNTNIKNYAKLNKDETIKLMMRPEHRSRFESIQNKSTRMPKTDISKLNREFKKKAKVPRKKFELKEESAKIKKAQEAKFGKTKGEPKTISVRRKR